MADTKKDILEWVMLRLASVPDDAQMEVNIMLSYLCEDGYYVQV